MKYPYPLVVVRWRDAVKRDSEQSAAEIAARPAGTVCVVVGWLVKDTPDGIALACEYEQDQADCIRVTWEIPRGMVLDVKSIGRRGKVRKSESGAQAPEVSDGEKSHD